jgi:Imelysin
MRHVGLSAALAVCCLIAAFGVHAAQAAQRPCSSYPTPGSLAPANATVPAALRAQYAVLDRPQRAADRLSPRRLGSSLSVAGVIRSGIRFLGDGGSGGRIYLIPARHVLAFPIAPDRCLPPDRRSVENQLRPQLRQAYAYPGLCLLLVLPGSEKPNCGRAAARSEALVSASGTPGFGLVPNGIRAVTVSYVGSPPHTVAVRNNFFAVVAPGQTPPCGLQWLDGNGNVLATIVGCSFFPSELGSLSEYDTYVTATLTTLQSQVAALITAISSGSLAQAQSAWLAAHLTWLDIGQDDGAYGAFGELGRQIDGTAAGLVGGTASPDFTGFHKVELDLWTDQNLVSAAGDAGELRTLVDQLVAVPLASELPATPNGIATLVLRPHEILEDANRDSLTAADDYGSGSDLASLTADIAATDEFLTVLAPVIDAQAPGLIGRADGELDALSAAISATTVDGTLPGIESLPTTQREQIDADVGAALETLAPIPDLITSTGGNGASDD